MNSYNQFHFEVTSSSSSETVDSVSNMGLRPPQYVPRDINLKMIVGKESGLNVPLGFCLGMNDDIVVADTDNHRVMVFDLHDGTLKFSFGVYGASPGCFVQPRKVRFCFIVLSNIHFLFL